MHACGWEAIWRFTFVARGWALASRRLACIRTSGVREGIRVILFVCFLVCLSFLPIALLFVLYFLSSSSFLERRIVVVVEREEDPWREVER